MTADDDRLASVEARLRALEDELAITRPVCRTGRRSTAATPTAWPPSGIYDVDELLMTGRGEIAAIVGSTAHQRQIAGGCAHLVGAPHVTVTGDASVLRPVTRW
ncbi:nuclear transport factor 2 family protein [Actinomadura xylanilytica]|uniref:nuclear transport factor 2 family protein n=1 Tax=Actinomadura xylanilytica TaxID=887459 RepID=UPI00255A8B41|nr:nuclear transport factor 2 family protein [Actinomadura xylanilytica]MDL4770688.1 nuclear transport factor 2 family protein [Actinomadura xylanilytica]